MTHLSRRDLLRGAAAGALIGGWDPVSRSWATAADRRRSLDRIPDLDGVLLADPASRRLAADDYGHFVHHEPLAVLRPASVEDIVKLVCFARDARSASRCAGRRTAATGSRRPAPGS
jgi:cytokinin dehydrogenase